MPGQHPIRRFTRTDPCPICGGHDGLARGQGVRCYGYYSPSGKLARCTREERAGGLPQNRDGTYSHRLHGPCRCGQTHGPADHAPAGNARSAGSGTLGRRAQQRFRSFATLCAFAQTPLRQGDDDPPLGLPGR